MIYHFSKYKIKKGDNFYILSCDKILQYENGQDELNHSGWCGTITPSCWDDTIIDKIGTTQYYVYHLYGLQLHHGCFNKLSDYKGIHKLTNRPVGVYENSYITPYGKVYTGISCALGVDEFYSNVSSILIVGPKLSLDQFQNIISKLKYHNYDFYTPPTLSLLSEISTCCQQSIVFSYSSNRESTLTIFPGAANLFFSEADVERWKSLVDVQPILRRN